MVTARQHIFKTIAFERGQQDRKWGSIQENPHSWLEWLALMQMELGEAERAIMQNGGVGVIDEVIQLGALAIAALEQHGLKE